MRGRFAILALVLFCVSMLAESGSLVAETEMQAETPESEQNLQSQLPSGLPIEPEIFAEDTREVYIVERTLFDQFHDGMMDGMFFFGQTLPFLLTYFLIWLVTIAWVPIAIIIVRRRASAIMKFSKAASESQSQRGEPEAEK
ncbi:hypothetical protein JMM59_14210 [Rhodovulum sulfidophilum]|uniref:hypothetical protein n=1 Tax=Rhodovulum sulfidophilum TaxID=35806 RepID=UPI0019238272|nr:hypothetical protein [Rhodovulum sulfidophilum]MBL3566146.1 hypothetical protein [Rhodovulum sulfidophilum]